MFNSRRNSPLTPAIKGLAAGVGLISVSPLQPMSTSSLTSSKEYSHHRKNRKAVLDDSQTSQNDGTGLQKGEDLADRGDHKVMHSEAQESVDDEHVWVLDDAQDEVDENSEPKKPKTPHDPAKLIKQFTNAHLVSPDGKQDLSSLALPVVLPQRRPKSRKRGFIRAYAPDLEHTGLDQETFLQFVEVFNNATLAAPWLNAINLASLAFSALPTGISMAISIAISVGVDVTKTVQSRFRHNYILEQLNNDFFRPRGLYALILTWQPDSPDMRLGVNVNEVVADNMAPRQGMLDKASHNLRPSMGNTVGLPFTVTAPLVFPELDSLTNSNTAEAKGFKESFKSAKGLTAEYMDRRAQAAHIGAHPDSDLAVTTPVFTSRYSDPNHPSNNGDLLSLVSGGMVSMPQRQSILSQRMGYRGYGYPERRRGGLLGAALQLRQSAPAQNPASYNGEDRQYLSGAGPRMQMGPPMGTPPAYSRSQSSLLPSSLIQSGIKRVFGSVSLHPHPVHLSFFGTHIEEIYCKPSVRMRLLLLITLPTARPVSSDHQHAVRRRPSRGADALEERRS